MPAGCKPRSAISPVRRRVVLERHDVLIPINDAFEPSPAAVNPATRRSGWPVKRSGIVATDLGRDSCRDEPGHGYGVAWVGSGGNGSVERSKLTPIRKPLMLCKINQHFI